MYRRPRFLEILIGIREEMAREADFDVDLFVENVRTGHRGIAMGARFPESNGEPQKKPAAIPKKAGIKR